jgi:hypothetical protein
MVVGRTGQVMNTDESKKMKTHMGGGDSIIAMYCYEKHLLYFRRAKRQPGESGRPATDQLPLNLLAVARADTTIVFGKDKSYYEPICICGKKVFEDETKCRPVEPFKMMCAGSQVNQETIRRQPKNTGPLSKRGSGERVQMEMEEARCVIKWVD